MCGGSSDVMDVFVSAAQFGDEGNCSRLAEAYSRDGAESGPEPPLVICIWDAECGIQ